MRRKIIKQKSAYTITLPIRWVRENHLEKAGELDLVEEDVGLLILAKKRQAQTKSVLDLKKGIPHYYRILIENEYLRGTSEIMIRYDQPEAMRVIRETVSNLIGFEILDEGKGTCRVGQTAMPTPQEFRAILRRLLNVIDYARDLILRDLRAQQFSNLSEITRLEDDTRRYSLFCRRVLHSQSVVSRTDESLWDLLLERLVITAYDHYFMYEKLSRETDRSRISDRVIRFYERASSMFVLFEKMFTIKDTSGFHKINDIWEEAYFRSGHSLSVRCNKKESIVVFHSISLAKMTWLISQPNTVLLKYPEAGLPD
ncbi:MAG: hypothetical protein AABX47_01355 [Nanoarchaeota archaeon]